MARLQTSDLFLLFMTATTLVQAATLFKDTSYVHQVPRQLGVGQGVSTSTFNYWWPYPAWTATAATSPAGAMAGMATTTFLPIPTTFAPTSTLQGGVLATLSVPPPDSSSILTFSGTLTTLSDTSLLVPSSSSSSTSISSSSTSASSSSTSASVPSSPTAPNSNSGFPSRGFFSSSHFLVPLIAAVSTAAVLSLLLWLICRHRRRARTSSSFYTEERGGWWSGLFGGRGDVFEETVPGPKYVGVEDDLEGSRCVEKEGARYFLGEDGGGGGGEQGGKLDIASWAAHAQASSGPVPKRKGKGTKSSRGSRYSRERGASKSVDLPLLSSSFAPAAIGFLSDEERDEDDEDKPEMRVPWESLRHKSIKRAIIAKVDEEKRWMDSMRSVRAARAVQAAIGGLEETDANLSQTGQGRNKGFRIVVESPPVRIPTPGSSGRSPPWSLASAFPFPLFSSGDHQRAGEEADDKYTPVPSPSENRSRSRSRRSSLRQDRQLHRQRQKRMQGKEPSPSRARPAYRPSPSVLRMRSPPSVMTPQMESALCFTPVVEASARMEEEEEKSGTVYTKTYRHRADRAMRRVEAIVDSAWSDRERC